MNDIKFSIVVPVYNSQKYLDRCVDSVLNQSYQNFELLLIDDGSMDESGAKCDYYACKYEQVRSFHKQNAGQLHTREYGIERAIGDFCVFLDSDDSLVPDALQVISTIINKYSCDCVIYNWRRVFEDRIIEPKTDGKVEIIQDKSKLYKKIFSNSKYNSLCIKAIKRSAFTSKDHSNHYGIRRSEDLLHSLDAIKNCEKIVFIPNSLYNYTMNSNSVTHTISYDNYRVDFTVREAVLKFLEEEDVFAPIDYVEYRSACVRMLVSDIIMISCFNVPFKVKKELFDNIKQVEYCKNFLLNGDIERRIVGKKVFLFDLFKKKHYRTLVSIVKAFLIMRRIKK